MTEGSVAALRRERHPVRLAHLGLGAFHRAHQAWYTQRANDAGGDWGIAAFTGRSPAAAELLHAQGEAYTLLERGPERDAAELVESISRAVDGADAAAWAATIADPAVVVLTVTVTEAGYEGAAPGRIAAGLAARREAGAGPIAVVACDNLADNGGGLAARVRAAAETGDAGLAEWIDGNVSFVSTVVDRITPATTPDDLAIASRLVGAHDAAPVVTEPYREWVLAGGFPAGRPEWERGGARFVDDIRPYEERKLWLLNAGHTLLAYAGLLRGFATVDEAVADPALRARLERLWAEHRAVLPLDAAELDEWLDALRARLANPRIRHTLEQIGRDGSYKLPERILQPIERRRAAGLDAGPEQLAVLADWGEVLARFGPTDAASTELAERLRAAPSPAARTGILDRYFETRPLMNGAAR